MQSQLVAPTFISAKSIKFRGPAELNAILRHDVALEMILLNEHSAATSSTEQRNEQACDKTQHENCHRETSGRKNRKTPSEEKIGRSIRRKNRKRFSDEKFGRAIGRDIGKRSSGYKFERDILKRVSGA